MNGIVGAVKHVSASKVRIHDLALGAYDCLAICRHIGSPKLYPRIATAFQELPYATKLPHGSFALFSGWSQIETWPRDAKIHLLSVNDVTDSLILMRPFCHQLPFLMSHELLRASFLTLRSWAGFLWSTKTLSRTLGYLRNRDGDGDGDGGACLAATAVSIASVAGLEERFVSLPPSSTVK